MLPKEVLTTYVATAASFIKDVESIDRWMDSRKVTSSLETKLERQRLLALKC